MRVFTTTLEFYGMDEHKICGLEVIIEHEHELFNGICCRTL
jgi:hypothetical protein